MLNLARARSRRAGLPFTLDLRHIVVPDICPVLGIPLERGGHGNDSSPSLDRVDPYLGYTPDNVRVISMRANRIKSNATSDELRAVADWMDATCTRR